MLTDLCLVVLMVEKNRTSFPLEYTEMDMDTACSQRKTFVGRGQAVMNGLRMLVENVVHDPCHTVGNNFSVILVARNNH